jgi:plastocyanin
MRSSFPLALFATLFLTVACGGEKKAADQSTAAGAPAPAALPTTAEPAPGGKIIEILATTDDKGNYFSPNKIEAHVGDVLRFKLVIGVHNVDFLPDSNPGKTGLPPVSPFLQLPGQTQDYLLNFGTGKFYFQCDPHALLGMKGTLEVEK